MKMEYKIYCHEHSEEIKIVNGTMDYSDGVISFEVRECSQCEAEAHQRGIESLLEKRYSSGYD